jgi:hypothetical protein
MMVGTSIFSHVNRNRNSFLNKFYSHEPMPLTPHTDTANVWFRYMLRFNYSALEHVDSALRNVDKMVENDEWELDTSESLWLPDVTALRELRMLSLLPGLLTDTSTSIKYLGQLQMLVINKNNLSSVRFPPTVFLLTGVDFFVLRLIPSSLAH